MPTLLNNSTRFTQETDLKRRKSLGQYMTPKEISDILFDIIKISPGDKVLDPAVGTGELLIAGYNREPNADYIGYDVDSNILQYTDERINSTCKDFLDARAKGEIKNSSFDTIIANPPYFEMKLSDDQKERYHHIVSGRANIFSLFIYESLTTVKEGGYIGLIIPPSMNSGAYFSKLRKEIINHAKIVSLKIVSDAHMFSNAQTAVQVLVLQRKTKDEFNAKNTPNPRYIFLSPNKKDNSELVLFSSQAEKLNMLWENKVSLWDLGYEAKTGSVIWNQYKETQDPAKDWLPLIYSKDITSDGKIVFNDSIGSKPRWIKRGYKTEITGGAVIVNRIAGGVGGQYLKAAVYYDDFYGENHVNVITSRNDVEQKCSIDDLVKKIHNVSSDYLSLFSGNAQISSKELTHHIPL